MNRIPPHSNSMDHGALLQLIDCTIELPAPHQGTVAFVPGLGFVSAIFIGQSPNTEPQWEDTIRRKPIQPTYWLRPYEIPDHFKTYLEVAERLEANKISVKDTLLFFEKFLKSFSHE